MSKQNPFLWVKKTGLIHIANRSETFCGMPMLGNNYADQTKDKPTCPTCLEKYNKAKAADEEKFSDCCGAPMKSNGDTDMGEIGICSECGDHCEYIAGEE